MNSEVAHSIICPSVRMVMGFHLKRRQKFKSKGMGEAKRRKHLDPSWGKGKEKLFKIFQELMAILEQLPADSITIWVYQGDLYIERADERGFILLESKEPYGKLFEFVFCNLEGLKREEDGIWNRQWSAQEKFSWVRYPFPSGFDFAQMNQAVLND